MATKMKAVYVPEPGKIQLIEKDVPSLERDTQVLVKIQAAGICGSDIHILHGTHAFVKYPRVIGHEGCGVVKEVGAAVSDLKPGDRVIIEPITGCGHCYACRNGRYNCCPNIKVLGVHEDGIMEEYLVVESNKLYKYDDSLTTVEAATAEPYTVGAQANAQANTQPGDLVLVHGAGPIGMIICDIATERGAKVIMSEPNEARLGIAKKFGAQYLINPVKEDLTERVGEICRENGLEGLNVIFETSGIPALMTLSVELLGPHGRMVPLTFAPEPIPINFRRVNANELVIAGTRNQNSKFDDVVKNLPGRKDRLDTLVTHTFDISEAEKAFETAMDKNSGSCKVVITFPD